MINSTFGMLMTRNIIENSHVHKLTIKRLNWGVAGQGKNMILKRFLLLVMGVLWLNTTYAQSTVLAVWLKSGGSVNYALSDYPVIRQKGEVVVLKTAKVEIEYPISNIDKMTFIDDISSVKAISDETKVSIKRKGDLVVITGEQPLSPVFVYTADGVTMKKVQSNDQGEAVVPISDMPKGVSIVKSKNFSYKIVVK